MSAKKETERSSTVYGDNITKTIVIAIAIITLLTIPILSAITINAQSEIGSSVTAVCQ